MSGNLIVFTVCIFGLALNINVWCREIPKGQNQLTNNNTTGISNSEYSYLRTKNSVLLKNKNSERLKSKTLKDAHVDISSFIKISKNDTNGNRMNALHTVVGHINKPSINDTAKHFFISVENETMNKTVNKKTAPRKANENAVTSKNTSGHNKMDAFLSIAGHFDKLNINNSAKHFSVPVESKTTLNKADHKNTVPSKSVQKTVIVQKKLIDILSKSKLNFHHIFHLFNMTVNDLLLITRMARHGAKLILKHANSDRLNYTMVSSQVGSLTTGFLTELYNRSYESTKMALYEIFSQVTYSWTPWSDCSVTCGPNGFKQRLLKVQIGKRVLYTDVHQALCHNSRNCLVGLTAWGEWSPCNSRCSPSYSVRKRYCLSNDCSSRKYQNTQRKRCLKPPCSLTRIKPSKHQPHQIRRPHKIKWPHQIQQPYRIQQPYKKQWPHKIHGLHRIQQPYRIPGPYRIQHPYWIIHGPHRIQQPYKIQPEETKQTTIKSTTLTTTTSTEMTTTSQRVLKGYWSPWSKWSACSVTCGLGLEIRQRECISPKRLSNEKVVCVKNLYIKQTRTCILSACNGDSAFSEVKHVIQGTDTTLHCGINGRHHLKGVYWITPKGKKITRHTKSQRYRIHHNKLTISETQWNDRGEYYCITVEGDFHQVKADAMIYVATCRSRLCKNGALCFEDAINFDHRHTTCHCKHGFYGRLCEKKDNTDILYIVTGICSGLFVAFTFALFVHWLWKKRNGNNKSVKLGDYPDLQKTDMGKDQDKTSKKLNTSVVSNDESLVEIDEKDYKNFNDQKLNENKITKTHGISDPKLNKDTKGELGKSTTRKKPDTSRSKEKVNKHSNTDVKSLKSSSKLKSKTNNDVYETVHKRESSQVFKGVSFEDELCIDLTDGNNKVVIQKASPSKQHSGLIYQNLPNPVSHKTTSKQTSALSGQVINNTRSSANQNQLSDHHAANTSPAPLSSNFRDGFSNLEITHMTSKHLSSDNYQNMPSAQGFSKSHVSSLTEPTNIYDPLIQQLPRHPTDVYLNLSDQGVEAENLFRQPTDIYLNVSEQGVEADTLSITHHTTTYASDYHLSGGKNSEKFYQNGNYEEQAPNENLEHFHVYGDGLSHNDFMHDQQQDFIRMQTQDAEENGETYEDANIVDSDNEFSNASNYQDNQMYEKVVTSTSLSNNNQTNDTVGELLHCNETSNIDKAEKAPQQTQDHNNLDSTDASHYETMIGNNLENETEMTYPDSSCHSCPSTLVEELVTEVIDEEAQKLTINTPNAKFGEQHLLQDQSLLDGGINIVHKNTRKPDTSLDQNENFKVKQDMNESEISVKDSEGETGEILDSCIDKQSKDQSDLASEDQINILSNHGSPQAGDSKDQQMYDSNLSSYKDCTSAVDTTLNSTAGYTSCGETPDVSSHSKTNNWITVRSNNELNNTQRSDSVLQHQDWDVYVDEELYETEKLKKREGKGPDDNQQKPSFSFTHEKENIFGEDDFLNELDEEWDD